MSKEEYKRMMLELKKPLTETGYGNEKLRLKNVKGELKKYYTTLGEILDGNQFGERERFDYLDTNMEETIWSYCQLREATPLC